MDPSASGRKGVELRRRVARALLQLNDGDRLPTVRELSRSLDGSLGATQVQLVRLEDEHALVVERRGRNGSFLIGRDLGALWLASERTPLIIGLPLPSTPRIHGLATAIKTLFGEAGVDNYLVFVRGSRNRLGALRLGRCHIAVMSSLAANERRKRVEPVVLELPAGSFVREHRVYFLASRGEESRMPRVIIDRDSADFVTLTNLEFGEKAEPVEATYMQFSRLLRERRVDAAILDIEEVDGSLPSFVTSRALSTRVLTEVGGANTRAAFVSRNPVAASVSQLVRACLIPERVLAIQEEVISGARVPEY